LTPEMPLNQENTKMSLGSKLYEPR